MSGSNERYNSMPLAVEAASLVLRSGYTHIRYLRPDARRHDMYAGKDISAATTAMFDLIGVNPARRVNMGHFSSAINGFNHQWRAYDEVVDEEGAVIHPDQPITPEQLDNTPVYHKYLGRNITGKEGMKVSLEAMQKIIPNNTPDARKRRDKYEGLLYTYRGAVVTMANNPAYQTGDTLPYPTALQSKEDITGVLGSIGVALCTLLLNLPDDPHTQDVYGRLNVSMQFGDDAFDWRKDRLGHRARKATTPLQIRPDENLYNATALEYPEEYAASEQILQDKAVKSIQGAKEVTPKTFDAFRSRFYTQLDAVPDHPRGNTLKRIYALTFDKLLPLLPESGPFFRWAKY